MENSRRAAAPVYYCLGSSSKNYLPDTSVEYANKLNEFFNRFDKHDFSDEIRGLRTTLENKIKKIKSESETVFQVSEHEVCHEFRRLNITKSAGPDGVTPRLLKLCASQLAEIFTVIFNLSFKTQLVPDIWKCSCIIPVPKKPVISCMNDLRPVALTSIPMKVCERLFKKYLSGYVEDYVDPLQFAYRSNRSCTDAILVMLEKLYHHCDRARFGNSVRITFFDFSSALNTIQPHLLIQKLLDHDIPGSLLAWILNYLTDRSQYVRITCNGTLSHCLKSNTGAPQGTVLAPFLFTLYTSDCRSSEPSCPLIKFADDTALISLIKDDDDTIYQQQLAKFVNYCDANFLEVNVSKTKEMIIDFRISSSTPCFIALKGSNVERVSSYKYLGIVIDDRLTWHTYIDFLIKRLNIRMYCFRKLNYFNVDARILAAFYDSVIASVWRYCLVCWGGNVVQGDKDKISRIVNEVGRIIGEPRQGFEAVYADLLIKKLTDVMGDVSHPLNDRLVDQLISRSGRMRSPPATTGRYLSSFVPQVIRLHNSKYQRGAFVTEM